MDTNPLRYLLPTISLTLFFVFVVATMIDAIEITVWKGVLTVLLFLLGFFTYAVAEFPKKK